MELKKLNTLFHSTAKISVLKSIIKNGFSPSYAKEKFLDRDVIIAMVSFSNIPIFEARSQVDYGKYSIGLKREWGIKNKLHPVTYTYLGSEKEISLNKLIKDFALFQSAEALASITNSVSFFEFQNFSENFTNLYKAILTTGNAPEIKKYFEEIFVDVDELQLFFKHYIDQNKRGKQVYCFNDREWRFIPNINRKMYYATTASGDSIAEYEQILLTKKPHLKNIRLDFDLEDIEFIMVKKNSEIKSVLQVLQTRFSKVRVQNSIENGDLTVFSFEKLYNSL